MSWLAGKYLAFDLETTSKYPAEARIVTATTILIDPTTGSKDVTNWLSDVDGQGIPEETVAIHGVTTDHARAHGQPAGEVVGEIERTIHRYWLQGIPVIGHNVGYDFTVLDCEVRRHWPDQGGLSARKAVLDTFVLDKQFDRYRKGSRKLTATAAHYGVPLSDADAHDATADALAAARILWVMAQRFPAIAAMTLAELYDAQVNWYRQQAISLGLHFASQGNHEHVPTEWPIRLTSAAVTG